MSRRSAAGMGSGRNFRTERWVNIASPIGIWRRSKLIEAGLREMVGRCRAGEYTRHGRLVKGGRGPAIARGPAAQRHPRAAAMSLSVKTPRYRARDIAA